MLLERGFSCNATLLEQVCEDSADTSRFKRGELEVGVLEFESLDRPTHAPLELFERSDLVGLGLNMSHNGGKEALKLTAIRRSSGLGSRLAEFDGVDLL
jgi:hypothetical protein